MLTGFKVNLFTFSFFLFDYALKRKSRAWMRCSDNELDEWNSGRTPARVESRVTEAM